MEMLMDILQTIIYTLITGCGMYVVYKLVGLLNEKIDEVQVTTDLKNYEQLNVIIDRAQSVLTTVVTSVSQSVVDSLKKAGQFTPEAQKEAKDKAIELAKEMLSEEAADAITEVYGNLDTYLDVTIEAIVKQLKK